MKQACSHHVNHSTCAHRGMTFPNHPAGGLRFLACSDEAMDNSISVENAPGTLAP
jgi:hypothetical protein